MERFVGEVSPEEPHSLKRLAGGLLLVNLISALLFIALVNRPVFDDLNNLPDVSRYAHSGVSAATVAAHHNPAGPGSFVCGWQGFSGYWGEARYGTRGWGPA